MELALSLSARFPVMPKSIVPAFLVKGVASIAQTFARLRQPLVRRRK